MRSIRKSEDQVGRGWVSEVGRKRGGEGRQRPHWDRWLPDAPLISSTRRDAQALGPRQACVTDWRPRYPGHCVTEETTMSNVYTIEIENSTIKTSCRFFLVLSLPSFLVGFHWRLSLLSDVPSGWSVCTWWQSFSTLFPDLQPVSL